MSPRFVLQTFRFIILLLFFFLCQSGRGQGIPNPYKTIDSLWEHLKIDKTLLDSLKTYHELAKQYNGVQNDTVVDLVRLILSKAPVTEKEIILRSNYELMRFTINRNRFGMGDSLAQVIFDLAEADQRKEWMFRSLNVRAILFSFANLRDSADYYFAEAKALMPYAKEEKYKADYYQFKGVHHRSVGELDKTLESYLNALDIYKKEKMYSSEANIYNNMGTIYGEKENYGMALESFGKALEINRKLNNERLVSNNLGNMGRTHLEMGSYQKAIEFYTESLKIENEENDVYEIAQLYNELGRAHSLLHYDEKAVYYYRLALKYQKKVQNDSGYLLASINVISHHLNREEPEKASKYLQESIPLASEKKLPFHKSKLLFLQSRLDSLRGDFKAAFFNYRRHKHLADSLEDVANSDKLRELQTKYETLEKQQEIENLNVLNKANELAIFRKRYQNYALWGALFFAIVIAGGLYSRYNVKGRLNKELALKNNEVKSKNTDLIQKSAQLKNALAEREVLIKEIHHRVKNNLQLITSMLNLQGEHTKSREVNKFLKRSQARIASMALVHQTLYNSHDLGTIHFKTYLEELLKAIYQSFDFGSKDIRYRVSGKEYALEIDTAINLGIIVNELAYNALKHAFVHKTSGLLEINVFKKKSILTVTVGDDGIGIPLPMEKDNKDSFGLTLVSLLVEQLGAELKMDSDEIGTQIQIALDIPT